MNKDHRTTEHGKNEDLDSAKKDRTRFQCVIQVFPSCVITLGYGRPFQRPSSSPNAVRRVFSARLYGSVDDQWTTLDKRKYVMIFNVCACCTYHC